MGLLRQAPITQMDGDPHTPGDAPTLTVEAKTAPWLTPKRARLMAIIAVGLLVLVVGGRWIGDRMAMVSTNDARVAADMVAVSTDISGRIVEKHVSSGDTVKAGDVLYSIDDRAAKYRLAEFEADVVRLQAEIDREAARIGLSSSKSGSTVAARNAESIAAEAAVGSAREDLIQAQREYTRAKDLHDRGFATDATYENAANALNSARLALAQAEAQLDRSGADRQVALVERDEVRLIEHELKVLQASLAQAQARVEGQRVVVDHHQIRSPIDGVIDELFYDVGEHSLQGFRVALLHDPDSVWVSANIKENQVRLIQAGARAEVRPDSEPGQLIVGEVGRVSDLTVAEAALMPNPNASGVFTKITQRIEVRIDLPDNELHLKPGTMVRVKIKKAFSSGGAQ